MSLEQTINGLNQLDRVQTKMFIDYGLRQIKYMFDVDKITEQSPPEGSELIGLSEFGRFTAINYIDKIRYSYFSHNKTWSEAMDFGNVTSFDLIKDFKFIYNAFNLGDYELNALTYIADNIKERVLKQQEKQL